MNKLEFIIDGVKHVNAIKSGDNLLININKSLVDVPQSCLVGICGSCKCLLLNGYVDKMEENVLTDKEISNGYILACSSKCIGEDIMITFDF